MSRGEFQLRRRARALGLVAVFVWGRAPALCDVLETFNWLCVQRNLGLGVPRGVEVGVYGRRECAWLSAVRCLSPTVLVEMRGGFVILLSISQFRLSLNLGQTLDVSDSWLLML